METNTMNNVVEEVMEESTGISKGSIALLTFAAIGIVASVTAATYGTVKGVKKLKDRKARTRELLEHLHDDEDFTEVPEEDETITE